MPRSSHQVAQARLGLGHGAGGEQLVGTEVGSEGVAGQGEVLLVHQGFSFVGASLRMGRGEGSGPGAGLPLWPAVRLRFTLVLA